MESKPGEYPPQYGQPQYGQPGYGQPVAMQPVHTTTIIQQAAPKPQNYLVLSIFVLLCCNLIFGLIALIFSLMSDSDYNGGDVDGAASKGKIAMWINIAGIIISVILVIVIVALAATGSLYVTTRYYYTG